MKLGDKVRLVNWEDPFYDGATGVLVSHNFAYPSLDLPELYVVRMDLTNENLNARPGYCEKIEQ